MLNPLQTLWLWFFGALVFGIVAGWLVYPYARLKRPARPLHVAIGAVGIGSILAVPHVVPGRYGDWLELGVIFTALSAIGCFVGWALRDLAEFMPAAAQLNTARWAAPNGSYLFRDAFAGIGAAASYMRTPASDTRGVRQRVALDRRTLSLALTQAPEPGGYTFPRTLPFADATTRRRVEPLAGMRRHWTWPKRDETSS